MARTRRWALVLALALTLVATGCRFDGIDNMTLPGGKGTGDDALVVTVELPDVGTLTPNAQVKVDDIAVGTVMKLRVEQWHAVAELSLEPDVELPANALASVGINTLLGSAYVELSSPAKAQGTLVSGDRIPLDRGRAYPSTEQVLSAASLALNGGGLEQLATITTELNRVLGGNDRALADLLPRLDSFVGTLDDQRTEILDAVKDVARMSRRFAKNRDVITTALDEFGPALEVLAKNRPDLTKALVALTDLSAVATPLVNQVKGDFVANLRDLVPVLQAVDAAGTSTVTALGFAVTFPFAPETLSKGCQSSYCNLMLTVDLTNDAIINGVTRPDGSIGIPGLPGLPDLGALLNNTLNGVTGLLNGLTLGARSAKGTDNATGSTTPKNKAKHNDDRPDKAPGDSTPGTLEALLGALLGGGR